MSRRKPRLLFISWAGKTTGYGRVLESVAANLFQAFDLHYLALNGASSTQPHPWQIHPTIQGDRLGEKQLPELLTLLRPDLVLLLFDFWFFAVHAETFSQFPEIATIIYCPIESQVVDPTPLHPLLGANKLVTYTQFGQSELQRSFTALDVRSPPTLQVVPHGVDTTVFVPLDEAKDKPSFTLTAVQNRRRLARQQLFPNRPDLEDAFIVLNANAPYPRKRLDLTIQGFDQFVRHKPPNVFLYLHGVNQARMFSSQTRAAFGRLRREGRLLTTADLFPRQHKLSDDQLNLLYNSCDVGINTAAAEGWGLTSMEHAATGAAQIYPEHGNCAEIWRNAGIGLTPESASPSRILNFYYHHVSATAVVAALDELYCYPHKLAHYSQLAYERATAYAFSWPRIARQWTQLFNQFICS